MRILLAEDEQELSRALTVILEHAHYAVDAVYDGDEALAYGLAENYDGLILDIMMPKRDGLAVLKALRAQGVTTPALFLTAKGEVSERIEGLDIGADDYLTKPFAMGELLARLRAMTRRRDVYQPTVLRLGNIALDRSTFELSSPSAAIRLGSKEFQMLELLMRQKGRLISTEQFMERIWGYDSDAELNVVWAYISYLRRKLEMVGSNVRIAARRGQGYLLEEIT